MVGDIRCILILVSLLGVTSSLTCFEKCMEVMGCASGNCETWENCCIVYKCNWINKCKLNNFILREKIYQINDFKVKNGELNEATKEISCDEGYWVNPHFNQENDFSVIGGHLRWKYDEETQAGETFPSWPLCPEFGVSPNTANTGTAPVWTLCQAAECFDDDNEYSDSDECNEMNCDVLDKKHLRGDTGDCCEEQADAEGTYCATSAISGVQTAKACDKRGCGWSWYCSMEEVDEVEDGEPRRGYNQWYKDFYDMYGDAPGSHSDKEESVSGHISSSCCQSESSSSDKYCYRCFEAARDAIVAIKGTTTLDDPNNCCSVNSDGSIDSCSNSNLSC